MLAENHQNKTHVNEIQVEEDHQTITSCKTYNNKDYKRLCKESAADCFQNTTVHSSKYFNDLGM